MCRQVRKQWHSQSKILRQKRVNWKANDGVPVNWETEKNEKKRKETERKKTKRKQGEK